MVDPVTLEVLRHRLQAINDELIQVTVRTTGSPTVYEAYDANSAVLTPSGDALCIGNYVLRLSLGFDTTVKHILGRYALNPGIRDGDMFYTNDPWAGAGHQNDTVMVAPIFWDGELVAWAGVSLHEMDVGGPLAGGYGAQARDVYGEAPLIPPVKIVEAGSVREDIEAVVLRNSRTPAFNALDMRGRLAAIVRARARIHETIRRYGVETFIEAQQRILDVAQQAMARRLRELPDGTWRQEGFLDYDRLYRVRLVATKAGDRLVLDLRDSSPQAPAMVNATQHLLEGSVMATILVELCYDMPWAPGAFKRNLEVLTTEGTLVHARHPAGVGQGGTAAAYLAQCLVSTALDKMFAASDKYRHESQANWVPSTKRPVVSGLNRRGEVYAITLIDQAGGGGALSYRDGPDTVHLAGAPMMAMGNVEVYERLYPVLYLYRKHAQDTGGPGKYRGGLGTEVALTPHKSPAPVQLLNLAGCAFHPEGRGLYGGLPTPAQPTFLLRGTDALEAMARGRTQGGYDELAARSTQVLKSRVVVKLRRGDVYVSVQAGGAGYGDPLERDPERVLADYLNGACSLEVCRQVYGVALDVHNKAVLAGETQALRQRLRQERLLGQVGRPGQHTDPSAVGATGRSPLRLGDAVTLLAGADGTVWACQRCGQTLGSGRQDFRRHAAVLEVGLDTYSPWNRFAWDTFVLRQFACPHCGHLLDVQPRRKKGPTMYDSVATDALAGWLAP
ncbi:MAG: hydantoinase B/oxoprolinase family protein [Chloroflexi bacterium]|nr:hydantoinase B/oxoprolinase family protein [Chloroflexota bacterium]